MGTYGVPRVDSAPNDTVNQMLKNINDEMEAAMIL